MIAFALLHACAEAPGNGATPPAEVRAIPQGVRPGIEVLLSDSLHLIRGKRVGLITNHTSITATGESGIALLARSPEIQLVALFAPEHGLEGALAAGARVSDRRTQAGVPIYSLYGATQRPTRAMLQGIDVLLFDIQDIGARPYTYVWTMVMAMEEAAKAGVHFIVLDRPNPITGRAEGPLMRREVRDSAQLITGYLPVPLRHGMTAGEIARYANGEHAVGARLTVVPASGWRASQWFDETGLLWVNPSPNIRSPDAALHYAGMVLLEATNLSVGRGTDAPFGMVGAPWLDAAAVLRQVVAYDLPGVRIDTATLLPSSGARFAGQRVRALRLTITDRDAYRPVLTALTLLTEIRRTHPRELRIERGGMLQMLGSHWAIAAMLRGDDPRAVWRRWEEELEGWRAMKERYRLYPD